MKHLISAAAIVAATSSAFAHEWKEYDDFRSARSRAEVVEELKYARAQGNYVVGGQESVVADANFVSTKTRAQVISELEQSKADGSYALAHGEHQGPYNALLPKVAMPASGIHVTAKR